MNSIRRFVPLAALALLFGAPLVAQTSVDSAGLLGKRYVGADFNYDQFIHSSLDQGMGASAVINLPVASALDVMVGYSYLDASGNNYGAIDKSLSASLVTHQNTEYGTGYFAGMLGHAWSNLGAPLSRHDNSALWGLRAGFEIPMGSRTAVNLGVGYSQAFDNNDYRAKVLRGGAELSHWFSRDVAGVVSVAYKEVSRYPDSIVYTLGLRWGF